MSNNLNTYEEYMLDYTRQAHPEVEAEMVKFLHSHPDIAAELDWIKPSKLFQSPNCLIQQGSA
jgi:hypothetical protein